MDIHCKMLVIVLKTLQTYRLIALHRKIFMVKKTKTMNALCLGMRTLCWNNFWNNRMEKESGIMLE